MSLEQKVNYQLNKYPAIKKVIKHCYQIVCYTVSKKHTHEGNIIRISPEGEGEYFFGYYDKSPWDVTGRYMLCMKAEDTWSDVSPRDPVELLIIDLKKNNSIKRIGISHSWNVQQGCMLQWMGPDFSSRIIYNDFRDKKFCSVIYDVATGNEKIIDKPVYTISEDGKTALTLDFTRLYRLRPGYGYYNLPEETANEDLPDKTCIWRIDLNSGVSVPLLKYTDLANFEPRHEMEGAVHKVNHLMISPNGERFMVLHRWFKGQRKYTRLVTCNVNGTDMYNLSDDDMVSHCCWKNNEEILAFEHKRDDGTGYYLMKDKTHQYSHHWYELSGDGHPTYSPDGTMVVTDGYPNRARIASVRIIRGENIKVIAQVFSPFKYDNDTRCDLHPRWSRDSKQICFDSVFEGYRGLYIVSVE